MSSIAIVGSVNLDLVAAVKKLPTPGETVTDATLDRFPGGTGANQALAARRLGADVCLVACVGGDPSAGEAVALLREGPAWEQFVAIPQGGPEASWDPDRHPPADALRWAAYTNTTPVQALVALNEWQGWLRGKQ